MAGWQVKQRQVALAGQVTDQESGQGIARAQVRLRPALPAGLSPYEVETAVNGRYVFLDLPDGDYQLTASVPGRPYLPVQATATIKRRPDGRIIPATVPISLPTVLPSAPKIMGCQLWLTAGLLTAQRHEQPLAYWPDASVHGHHASNRANAAHKLPTFCSHWHNGRPALRFAADYRQYLELPLSGPAFDHTFFVVFEQTVSRRAVLIDTQKGGIQLVTKPTVPPGPQIWSWLFSGSEANPQVTLYQNGRIRATSYQPQSSINALLTIGAKHTHRSRFFTGYIAEVIYFNRTVTEQERQTVEQFLNHRYGLSHPEN